MDINLLLILIRQIMALVGRALAEVRTVPVLLVKDCFAVYIAIIVTCFSLRHVVHIDSFYL